MKRVKIIKKFKDLQRYDRIYPLGTIYEVEDDRAEELIEKGFVEEVQAKEEDIIFTIGGKEVGRIKAEATVDSLPEANTTKEEEEQEEAKENQQPVETPEDKKPEVEKAVPSKKPQPKKKK